MVSCSDPAVGTDDAGPGTDGSAADAGEALDGALARCLDTDFWRGQDGELWRMAHPKVRPIQAVKSGDNPGPIPLADYDDDYRLFVWTQSDDRDAREVLTANYFVVADEETGELVRVDDQAGQNVDRDKRAGMLTTRWFRSLFIMFTGLPRTAAAQAYRVYLGHDIAKIQGVYQWPVEGEPVDYDDKGVQADGCKGCHEVLDPLSYPFSRYHGLDRYRGGGYNPGRVALFAGEGPLMVDTPEAGWIFGEQVADLTEWARVAADSDDFAKSTVADYWRRLVGHAPTPAQTGEFRTLWKDFRDVHRYRVEPMLRDLIHTEAYGAP